MHGTQGHKEMKPKHPSDPHSAFVALCETPSPAVSKKWLTQSHKVTKE